MASTFRKFRYIRKAARSQWYINGWVFVVFIVAPALGLAIYFMVWQQWPAATLFTAYMAWSGWKWWKQRQAEAVFWDRRKRLLVWFVDGHLYASSDGVALSPPRNLSDVTAIDAVVVRKSIVRLLVDTQSGDRLLFVGLDDMEAFAGEFRLNAPHACFRRVRIGLTLKLKEI